MAEKLSPGVAATLLDKLASDDGFRDRFASDPSAALASIGHQSKAGETEPASACLSVKELASKEAIKAARADIEKMLGATLGLQPHKIDAKHR